MQTVTPVLCYDTAMNLHLSTEYPESTTDGAGIRYSVYTQGCRGGMFAPGVISNCKGCQNPETWSFAEDAPGSYFISTGDLVKKIQKHKFSWGRLTLCGGDPIWQAPACIELIQNLKQFKVDYNVWAYTGLKFEWILEKADAENRWREYLESIDVLIDGPFILSQRDITLPWRGSSNQRVIDVPATLKTGTVTLVETD